MKINELTESVKSFSAEKKQNSNPIVATVMLATFLLLVFVPFNALASLERYVLEFKDSHIMSGNDQTATLFLKKSLKLQYPHLEVDNLDLRQVVLVAKSHMGVGGAQLRVGNWQTKMYPVNGNPQIFYDNGGYSFDRVYLYNPSKNSNGPWQVDFKGNFIVRKVILEVENHSWSRYHMEWRNSVR